VSTIAVLLLALSPGLHAPDLQVEAGTAAGVALPELAEAVARALVASGARVVLGGPANEPCPRCARVAVTELGQGRCRVDVTQDAGAASTTLSLGTGIALFDRARAIAIQARLLVRGEPVARQESQRQRKGATKPTPDSPRVAVPAVAELPSPLPESPREPVASKASSTEPAPATPPARRVEAATPLPKPAPTLAERTQPARRPQVEKVEEGKRQPPTLEPTVIARKTEPGSARWPWIPFTVGVGAAAGAALCVFAAQQRYDALSDKSRPYSQAVSLKQEGEHWQTAAFIASGVAVAGLGVGIWGFATSRPANSFTPTVAVLPGGAMFAMTGELP
jgi:hypothetical protein